MSSNTGTATGEGEDIFDEELDDSEVAERRRKDAAMALRYGLKKQQARNLDKLEAEAAVTAQAAKVQQRMAHIMGAAKAEFSVRLRMEEQLQRVDLDMQKLQPAADQIARKLYQQEQRALKQLTSQRHRVREQMLHNKDLKGL